MAASVGYVCLASLNKIEMALLTHLDSKTLAAELFKCCGSTRWATLLSTKTPFQDLNDLLEKSDTIWSSCTKEDGLEAFSHHPKIGSLKNLEKKYASTQEWAGNEQASVQQANSETLIALAKGNAAYEDKFGFIFIVCATGKTANEMLYLLNERLGNDPEKEWVIAMQEQNKITKIRIEKLVA
jgi:2-oxo-4-hydroxy-4-carboxy-5-ureidoimidazoline decarboxylase